MIGRAILGNPWLIRKIATGINEEISYENKIMMCYKHLNYLMKFKCEKVAVLEMRGHISWYLRGMPDIQTVKNDIFKANTSEEIKKILSNYLKKVKNNI